MLAGAHLRRRSHGSGQCVQHAVGHAQRAVGPARLLGQHHELVATEATDQVTCSGLGLQALGEHHEELVAGGVSERVVHPLEAVEVDEEDGQGVACAEGRRQAPVELGHQMGAVGQAREGVMGGGVADALLERLALGDVLHRADHIAQRPVLVAHTSGQHPHRAIPGGTGGPHPDLHVEHLTALVEAGDGSSDLVPVVGMGQVEPVGDLVEAGDRPEGLVGVVDLAVAVGAEHTKGDGLGQHSEPVFALGERVAGDHVGVDVDERAAHQHLTGLVAATGEEGAVDPAPALVLGGEPGPQAAGHAVVVEHTGEGHERLPQIIGMHRRQGGTEEGGVVLVEHPRDRPVDLRDLAARRDGHRRAGIGAGNDAERGARFEGVGVVREDVGDGARLRGDVGDGEQRGPVDPFETQEHLGHALPARLLVAGDGQRLVGRDDDGDEEREVLRQKRGERRWSGHLEQGVRVDCVEAGARQAAHQHLEGGHPPEALPHARVRLHGHPLPSARPGSH